MDVATILEQLRAEVRTQREQQADDDPALSALERELRHHYEQLEITRVVSSHWPLEPRTLPQRAVAFVNRVVRCSLRWYIDPIVEQQNAFNDVATRTMRLLIESHLELHAALVQQPPDDGTSGLPPRPVNTTAAPLDTTAADLAARRTVSAHWPLRGRTAPEQASVLAKRTVRQYLRWYINPIVEQQNAFNDAASEALPALIAADAELRRRRGDTATRGES